MPTIRPTSRPCKNYAEFLKHTLLPLETPPTDGNCAVCRLDFIEEEKEEPPDEIDYGITTQSRILAAAFAAAKAEAESFHDIVVRVRRCGHIFHRKCICTWITGDVAAPQARRSCPLCKTELIRYGPCARAEYLYFEICRVGEAISELEVLYSNAHEPLRKLEELEHEVACVMERFRHTTCDLCTTTKDHLFTQPHAILEQDENWARDLPYLEQLLLDGHSVPESIQTWYVYKLETAQDAFRIQSRHISAQLATLQNRLDEVEEALMELTAGLYYAYGFSDNQVSAQLLYDFHVSAYAPADQAPNQPQEGSWYQDDTGLDLYLAGVDADWLRNKIVWVKFWLEALEAAGLLETEEDAIDVSTAHMDGHGMENDQMEVEGSSDRKEETGRGEQAEKEMEVDALRNLSLG
jgi:hypothetical protein